jgi:threonine dehydrogenase-like Zn-dependent dehydrogenase
MKTMRVVQVPRPKGAFEIVERPIPEPGAGTVRVKVEACGVCHSDSITKDGLFPGIQYPPMRCATAAHGRAMSSPCSGWAVSATSESSTPRRWASTRSASQRGMIAG